jgi:hypothetical protein
MTKRDSAIASLALKAAARRKRWSSADFDEHGFCYPAGDGTQLRFHKEQATWLVIFEDRWGYERLPGGLAAEAAKIHEKLRACKSSDLDG